jgi:hypothetical protein
MKVVPATGVAKTQSNPPREAFTIIVVVGYLSIQRGIDQCNDQLKYRSAMIRLAAQAN